MRQKELRIALICYGGISLAVYMHGVTKEVWKLARASRAFHAREPRPAGVEGVYHDLLDMISREKGLILRVLPDIVTGASAGGINAIFLAQAIHSGRSLEPLTNLWLDTADVDALVDPAARPGWRFAKFWAQPIAWWLLHRPGNVVSESVSPETRDEVRHKVSRLIRSRWFEPPFSGPGFTRLLFDAIRAMENGDCGPPLLPPGHPIDLLVTATDFHGFLEPLRLHSPPLVEENEHRLPISFSSRAPAKGGRDLAHVLELTFAARATASFPGAFPPLRIGEIDALARIDTIEWASRKAFLERIMPTHVRMGNEETVSLIDGSVLVNAPFAAAIAALPARPAQREVDRRFVYIDPTPERSSPGELQERRPVGFFNAIFGSLSTIPREQPIRDNLELLERQTLEAERLQQIVVGLRVGVERKVDALLGQTLALDRPTPDKLAEWRQTAHRVATEGAGYAFHGYAQAKLAGIVERIAATLIEAAPQLGHHAREKVMASLRAELGRRGLSKPETWENGVKPEAIAFLRSHDLTFRIRRLRLIARRLSREWEADPLIAEEALDEARETIYKILAIYFARDGSAVLGEGFGAIAARVLEDPGLVIDTLGSLRNLLEADTRAEAQLTEALETMPGPLRRRILLAYLGFPFYDVATLPLLRNEGLTEFEGAKVDRISPDDATSIRSGGTRATLRGTEFYNFGAFFSRSYRENDYLWGRLHGAERMIDLVCSTIPTGLKEADCARFKSAAFHAILAEERGRLACDPALIDRIEREIGS